MVYVTHDQTEALTFADVVVVMEAGRVVQAGTPDELFERPAHRFVGHFIGSPGMSFLPCTTDDRTVSVAGTPLVTLPEGAAADDLVLGVRPEFVECAAAGAPGTLAATVTETRDLGAGHLVALDLGGSPLVARTRRAPGRGPCGVRFTPGQVHVFGGDGRRIEGVA
jgi:glycerol transport system ATP-binding protein